MKIKKNESLEEFLARLSDKELTAWENQAKSDFDSMIYKSSSTTNAIIAAIIVLDNEKKRRQRSEI